MAIQYADSKTYDKLTAEGFVIVDFFTSTCIPCKDFSEILEDIEAELPFVNIVKANVSEDRELGNRFNIRSVPTVRFYQDGELKEERFGLIPEDELREIISSYIY